MELEIEVVLQVITTINYPTDTIKLLASAQDWKVLVVADRKTPADWTLENVTILTVDKQRDLAYSIMDLLPFDHYGCGVPDCANRFNSQAPMLLLWFSGCRSP